LRKPCSRVSLPALNKCFIGRLNVFPALKVGIIRKQLFNCLPEYRNGPDRMNKTAGERIIQPDKVLKEILIIC
jgi:hypothetical protein